MRAAANSIFMAVFIVLAVLAFLDGRIVHAIASISIYGILRMDANHREVVRLIKESRS